MKLTEIAIKENRLTLTLAVFIVMGGLIALFNLPRSEDPKIPFRFAFVTTIYPGASAERMENLVTRKIEEAVKEAPEVEFVNSLSRRNASGIVIKLKDDYKDLRPIWDRLRRKIERVGNDLPDGVKGPFFNDEYGEVFGIIVTISSRNLPYREIKNAIDALHQRLLGLSQVSKVIELGQREERITITYDDADMAEVGFSPFLFKSYLEAQNVIAPGGGLLQGRERIATEPASDLKNLQNIENLYVAFPKTKTPLAWANWRMSPADSKTPPTACCDLPEFPPSVLGFPCGKAETSKSWGTRFRRRLTIFPVPPSKDCNSTMWPSSRNG